MSKITHDGDWIPIGGWKSHSDFLDWLTPRIDGAIHQLVDARLDELGLPRPTIMTSDE